MREETLKARAFHEAGHAVACWRFGLPVHGATIRPSNGKLGGVTHDTQLRDAGIGWCISTRGQSVVEKNALVALIGPAAQRKFNSHSLRTYHGSNDRTTAMRLLATLCDGNMKEARAYYRFMELRAARFVDDLQNWWSIYELARQLLLCRTLSAKQVKHSLSTFEQPRDPRKMQLDRNSKRGKNDNRQIVETASEKN